MLVAKTDELRRRRQEAGLSREKLSILAGLPSNLIFRIERGKVGYTYPIRARAIAKALHCKLSDILYLVKCP